MAFQGLRQIAKGEANIDFMGRTRLWFRISGVVLLAGTLGLVFRGFNLGLEFKGGTSFTVPLQRSVSVADIRTALQPIGLTEVNIQIGTDASGHREALVRTRHISDSKKLDDTRSTLAKAAGLPSPDAINLTDVGPVWGRQISSKALRGLIVFLIAVVAYISFRFEPKMAVAALVALFHDLLATAGIYALVGFVVTPATVIALLTLLGYSLYDTVVVFDKVRENSEGLTGRSATTYSDMVNRSVNRVLMRSINTSLTGLLPVGGLLFVGAFLLGAATLKDLALALFVGILVGTYSSIFIASPVLALWKEREPRYRQLRARAAPRPAMAAAVPVGASTTESVPATPGAPRAPMRVQRAAPRPRRRKRGRRRR